MRVRACSTQPCSRLQCQWHKIGLGSEEVVGDAGLLEPSWSSCSCMPGSGSGNTNCPDYGAWRLRACQSAEQQHGAINWMPRIESRLFLPLPFHSTFHCLKIDFCQIDWDPYPIYSYWHTEQNTLASLSYTFQWTFLAWNIWRRNATNYEVDNCVNSHRSLDPHLLFTLLPAYFVLKSRNLGRVTLMLRGPLCPVKYGVWLRAIGTSGGHFVTLELLVKICRGMQRVSSCMDLILWEF